MEIREGVRELPEGREEAPDVLGRVDHMSDSRLLERGECHGSLVTPHVESRDYESRGVGGGELDGQADLVVGGRLVVNGLERAVTAKLLLEGVGHEAGATWRITGGTNILLRGFHEKQEEPNERRRRRREGGCESTKIDFLGNTGP